MGGARRRQTLVVQGPCFDANILVIAFFCHGTVEKDMGNIWMGSEKRLEIIRVN